MKTLTEIYEAHREPIKRKLSAKAQAAKDAKDALKAMKKRKRNKYNAVGVTIDGKYFHSTGEGNYYLRLKDMQLNGEIKEFKRQVPFDFFVSGVKVARYVADFVVINNDGSIDVLDYKSEVTAKLQSYQRAKKLMLACYGVEVKEVYKPYRKFVK